MKETQRAEGVSYDVVVQRLECDPEWTLHDPNADGCPSPGILIESLKTLSEEYRKIFHKAVVYNSVTDAAQAEARLVGTILQWCRERGKPDWEIERVDANHPVIGHVRGTLSSSVYVPPPNSYACAHVQS
jgi:hypothetical protein